MKTNPILYRICRPVFTFFFKVIFHPEIENKEYIPKTGRCVLAGNHKHALDPILVDISTRRSIHTLAKKDLQDGMFGFFFKAVGTIPVDFTKEKNHEAMVSAVECLNKDCLVNLSPEAGRNYTQEILLPFKMGAVVMAQRTHSPVVPYSITGDYRLFHNNLKICFGEPIDFSGMEPERANEILFDKIKQLLIRNREDGSAIKG